MDATIIRRADAKCRHCNADMDIIKVKKYGGAWALWMIGAGVLLSLIGGLLFGVLMLLGGLYMATAEETFCSCPKCGYYFKILLVRQGTEE
jgi:hypothetical protein